MYNQLIINFPSNTDIIKRPLHNNCNYRYETAKKRQLLPIRMNGSDELPPVLFSRKIFTSFSAADINLCRRKTDPRKSTSRKRAILIFAARGQLKEPDIAEPIRQKSNLHKSNYVGNAARSREKERWKSEPLM